jgi:hypothetical protein
VLGLAACSSAVPSSSGDSATSDVTEATADDAACNASKSADGWCWAVANQPNFVGRVLAFGDDDAWVTAGRGTLARFDGTSWKPVQVPATVSAIWGTSSNDLYAVGQALDAVGFDKGVVLHFDGSVWTKVAESARNLVSIWGRAPNDILVGGGGYSMLRFDGKSWKELAPHVDSTLGLFYTAIDGTSADDIWVSSNTGDGQNPLRHWDGTKWSIGAEGFTEVMLDIDALRAFSKNDVWAGGYVELNHFDGTKWSAVPFKPGGSNNWHVNSILGPNSNDLYISLNRDNGARSQLFHWDGSAMTEITDFPLEGAYSPGIGGMSLTANGTLWITRGNSVLRRKANGSFERTTAGPLTTFLRASSNGNFIAAVGRSGLITTHTPDGGWKTSRALAPVNGSEPWLYGVATPDDKTVAAAGTGDFVTMSGAQASPEKPWADDLPSTGGPSVSAVTPDDVWIATRRKVFHRIGNRWAEIAPPPTTNGLGQILAVSANEVYLATDTGLYLYDRGAWTRKWEMPVAYLAHTAGGSLWGSSLKGRFVKDGGVVAIPDAELAKDVYQTTGLATCPDGRLYALTGWSGIVSFDGTTWKKEDVGGYRDLGGITCTADNTVWLFGADGTVLKKTH